MPGIQPALIVLTGSIASGKSTVGRRAVLETRLRFIPEDVDTHEEDRRVLDAYYTAVADFAREGAGKAASSRTTEDIRAVVFATQAHFIRRRAATLRRHASEEGGSLVERHPYDDLEVFSRRNVEQGLLAGHDLVELRRLAEDELKGVPPPALVIFLHADPARLRERIARRGRSQERDLVRPDNPYLDELSRLYADWFARCPFPKEQIGTDDLDEGAIAARVRETVRASGLG
jgi:deoxyadenosine/deoxycytidine kinase